MDPVVIALYVVAAVAAGLAVCLFVRVDQEAATRRKTAGEVAVVLSELGSTRFSALALAFSQLRMRDFFHELGSLFKLILGPREALLAEFAGFFKRAATHPAGLKLLQDAVASVTTSPAKPTAA